MSPCVSQTTTENIRGSDLISVICMENVQKQKCYTVKFCDRSMVGISCEENLKMYIHITDLENTQQNSCNEILRPEKKKTFLSNEIQDLLCNEIQDLYIVLNIFAKVKTNMPITYVNINNTYAYVKNI